MEEIILRY